jgi:hypothetical protein
VPYTKQVNQTNVMAFVSWSVAPKSNPDDLEFFTSEHHAVNFAVDEVDDYGSPMIVYRNDIEWMEVSA